MKMFLTLALAVIFTGPFVSSAQAQTQDGVDTTIAEEIPDSRNWKGCAEDNDCVIIGHGCFIDSVNEKFESEAENNLEDSNKDLDCEEHEDKSDDASAVCTESICTVQYE